jgi:class 3 adenylate cyclase
MDRLGVILRRSIGGLVEQIEQAGGSVLSFAGDALLAFWEDAAGVEAAVACALMATSQEGPLVFKTGVAHGKLSLVSLTPTDQLPIGPAVQEACLMERGAGACQVIVSPSIWARLENARGTPHLQGGWLVNGLEESLPLKVFEPEAETWSADLQESSILLAHLPTAHQDLPRLQALVSALKQEAQSLGGSLNKVSIDDKGVVLLCGMVGQSRAEDRMVALARWLQEEDFPNCGIGVTAGPVFQGRFIERPGAPIELIGDAVNRAARLATVGPGIRCDMAIATRCSRTRLLQQAPVRIKGQEAPIDVWTPHRGSTALLTDPIPASEQTPATRLLLKALSIWDHGTNLEGLKATLPYHSGSLGQSLEPLVDSGTLSCTPSGICFSNDAERRQIYRSLLQEQRKSLHKAAAAWLKAQGFVLEASEHMARAGNTADASSLLEEETRAALARQDLDQAEVWVTRLTALRNIPTPRISRLAAKLMMLKGDTAGAALLLGPMEPANTGLLSIFISTILSGLLKLTGDTQPPEIVEVARLKAELSRQQGKWLLEKLWRLRAWAEGG